jgi:hypothetical protein
MDLIVHRAAEGVRLRCKIGVKVPGGCPLSPRPSAGALLTVRLTCAPAGREEGGAETRRLWEMFFERFNTRIVVLVVLTIVVAVNSFLFFHVYLPRTTITTPTPASLPRTERTSAAPTVEEKPRPTPTVEEKPPPATRSQYEREPPTATPMASPPATPSASPTATPSPSASPSP